MANQNNRKQTPLIIGAVVIVLLLLVGGLWLTSRQKNTDTPAENVEASAAPKKKRISAPLNVIDLTERPVVTLRPFAQDGGRFVNIAVETLNKPATNAEYEIVYNVLGTSAVSASGSKIAVPDGEEEGGLQAFIGELDLASLPTQTANRFGTCSAGCACINNNVDYGELTLTFDGADKYGVHSNWTYFETGKSRSVTTDGEFTLVADALADAKDYLIMQAIGLPAGLTGTPVTISDGGKDNGTQAVGYILSFTTAPIGEMLATLDFGSHTGGSVAVYDGTTWSAHGLTDEVPLGNNYYYVLLQ